RPPWPRQGDGIAVRGDRVPPGIFDGDNGLRAEGGATARSGGLGREDELVRRADGDDERRTLGTQGITGVGSGQDVTGRGGVYGATAERSHTAGRCRRAAREGACAR